MIKEICKDTTILSEPSRPAVKRDTRLIRDMLDTMNAHENCLGMAADIIGENVCILVAKAEKEPLVMCNPKITWSKNPVETTEGCLCYEGTKDAVRYTEIEVEYKDRHWKTRKKVFKGVLAGVIQHEMDHMKGIMI